MAKVSKKYKFAVIATDVAIFTIKDNELNVLLIKMKKEPYSDCWALPGGLIDPKKSIDESAREHLLVKTGLRNIYLEQLYTFGQVDRDPFGRVVSVAYFALIPDKGAELKTSKEYDEVKWFSANKLPKLAYDHKEMIALAVERLASKLEYTNIVYGLLPLEFSLGELQGVYEIILGEKLDKRNFRKKIFSLRLVKKTGRYEIGKANRPAELYKFVDRTPKIVEIL